MPSGRIVGIIMLGAAVVVCLLGAALLLPRTFAEGPERLTMAAAVLGLVLTAIIALPLGAAGVYMLVRGKQEAQTEATAQKQRRLLDMVSSRGQLPISDAAVELQVPRDDVRNWIYRLVGLGVFTGYINWDDGVLYSAEAANLRNLTNCKKCGGELQLAGKGVIKCPYCGTEYFL